MIFSLYVLKLYFVWISHLSHSRYLLFSIKSNFFNQLNRSNILCTVKIIKLFMCNFLSLMLLPLSGSRYCLQQWLSTLVRPWPGKFFSYKMKPRTINVRARYRVATRRLRNTGLQRHILVYRRSVAFRKDNRPIFTSTKSRDNYNLTKFNQNRIT